MKRLVLELDTMEVNYMNSSNLQGVLFEHMSSNYAEILHMQQRHPYSQYIYQKDGKNYWCINALDYEAEQEILEPILCDEFQTFEIKKQSQNVNICSKKIIELKQEDLVKEFYGNVPSRIYHIELVTPTAFKQGGKYVFYPDLRLIYQSLMNKYSAVLPDMEMMDLDILDMLVEKSEIIKYRLRTVNFPMSGVKIPAFLGSFTVKINGAETLSAYAKLLFKFGEYAGVGIKTAMGMGAMRVIEGGKEKCEMKK